MFGIDAKEVFQKKMSDIISILFAIHILAIIFFFVIKWIRPYLKNRASAHNKQTSKYPPFFCSRTQSKKRKSICNNCEGEITDDEYISIFGNLKTLIDIAESNSSKTLLDSSNLLKINMMSDSEFENALSLGNFLRKISKRKCSCEAQTNITIDPGMKVVDYSYPELILLNSIPESIIKTCESSDSFVTVSSQESSTDIQKELDQIINELESDDGQKLKSEEDITIKKLQKYLKASLAKADAVSSFGVSGNRVSKDNKLLEMAITEFEKELKPIKDQINILKECIKGFDVDSNTQNRLSSDFTSSTSRSGMFSECFSGTVSTTCSTDLKSYFSSYHIISASSFGPKETDSRSDNMNKLDKITSSHPPKTKHKNNRCNRNCLIVNKEGPKTQEVLKSPEKCKLIKRSPIAEMYVKLSQCSSHSLCLARNKSEKLSSDNTVTYRIDLNVNLAGVPVLNSEKPKLLKEGKILPLTADPEDILGKPSTTTFSLQPSMK